jgi:hypothetical protein
MRNLAFSFLFLLGLTTVVTATDRHVDPANGSDTNDGLSLTTAFKTAQRCENAMSNGDRCVLHAGAYDLGVPPVVVTGQKTFVQFGQDVIDLKLTNGTTIRFTGAASTWNPPGAMTLVQMLALGRMGADPQPVPEGVVYVELYIDGGTIPVAVNSGPSLPVVLNFTLRQSGKARNRTLKIVVHQ